MTFFSKNLAGAETLGDKLLHLRKEDGLSLKELSQMIKVRIDYLSYLESGQYEKLPGEVYVRNFLKLYAQALKIDSQKVLTMYDGEQSVYQHVKPSQVSYIVPGEVSQPAVFFSPKLIKRGLICLGMIILTVYFAREISGIISPPDLTIDTPPDNLVIVQKTIIVRGQAEKEAKIYINNEEILAGAEGRFEEELDLQSGINVIKISAKKKHSKESVVLRKIRVEDDKALLWGGSKRGSQSIKIGQFNN